MKAAQLITGRFMIMPAADVPAAGWPWRAISLTLSRRRGEGRHRDEFGWRGYRLYFTFLQMGIIPHSPEHSIIMRGFSEVHQRITTLLGHHVFNLCNGAASYHGIESDNLRFLFNDKYLAEKLVTGAKLVAFLPAPWHRGRRGRDRCGFRR